MTHNPFTGIENATVSRGGVNFNAGTYLVKIEECLSKMSRKKDDLFIIETTVIAPLTRNGGENLAGSKPSQVMNLTKHEAAMGNVKQFIAAIANGDEAAVTGQVALVVTSASQPFRGKFAVVQCEQIKTQQGGDFTLHRWQYCSEEQAKALAAQAQTLPPVPQRSASVAPSSPVAAIAPASAPVAQAAPSVAPSAPSAFDFFK